MMKTTASPSSIKRAAISWLLMAYALVLSPTLSNAQEVVEQYTATIAPQDRVNSSGAALDDVAAILAQDRANFHRFGIAQPGDEADGLFADRTARAAIPDMVARGDIDTATGQAIVSGGTAQVSVEIVRVSGVLNLRVRLTDATAQQASQASSLPGFSSSSAVSETQWQVSHDPDELRGIAEIPVSSEARVAFECTRAGADPARFTGTGALLPHQPDVLFLLVERAAFSSSDAIPAGQNLSVTFAIDGTTLATTALAPLNNGTIYGLSIPSSNPVFDQLRAGARLDLEDTATGAAAMIPLTGFATALNRLQTICGTPAGQPTASPGLSNLQSPTPSAPVVQGPVLRGNDTVAQRFALWLIGQRPTLLSDRASIHAVGSADLPQGYPEYDPTKLGDQAYILSFGQQVAAQAAKQGLPTTIELDIAVAINRTDPSLPFTLDFSNFRQPLVNHQLERSTPQAVRTLQVALPFNGGQLFLREAEVLRLTLPEAISEMEPVRTDGSADYNAFGNDRIVLRTLLTISDPQVMLPVGTQRSYSSGVAMQATATVQQATLIQQKSSRDAPVEEERLAAWTRPQGGASSDAIASPDFMSRIDGQSEEGRLSVASYNYRQTTGRANVVSTTGQDLSSAQRDALKLIRAAAILASSEERKLADNAVLDLLFSVVDPIARDRMVPAGFQRTARDSNLNEIAFAQAVQAAEPKVRAYIQSAAPAFPMAVRMRSLATIGEYDLASQSLPWSLPLNNLSVLPDPQFRNLLSQVARDIPDIITLPPSDANLLLQALEVDTIQARQVPITLDYTIEAAEAFSGGGQVTLAELDKVRLRYRLENIRLHADLAEARLLLKHDFPQPEELSEAERIPEDIFRTTPNSIWATFAKATNNSEGLSDYVRNTPAFRQATKSMSETQKASLLQSETTRIAKESLDAFWVSVSLTPQDYDAAAGELRIRSAGITAIPHDRAELRSTIPDVGFGRNSRFDRLSMTSEEYDAFQTVLNNGRSISALALVTPALEQDGGSYVLLVNPPTELLFVEEGRGLEPSRVVLRLDLPEEKGLSVADPDPETPSAINAPDMLVLDGEGLDLLALAKQPDVYDDASYQRMLVERIARERQAAQNGTTPTWGAFFDNPEQKVGPNTIAQVLPAFRAWTESRAAALPDRFVLPYATNNGRHPETTCRSARRLPDQDVTTRAAGSNLASFVPGFTAPGQRVQITGQIAQPGPRDVILLVGRATHPNGNCEYLNVRGGRSDLTPDATGIDYSAAPYVDAVVVAEYPIIPVRNQIASIDYVLDAKQIEFVQTAGAPGDQPGLRGVFVITGDVTRAEKIVYDPQSRQFVRTDPVEADEWLSLLPSDDSPTRDILGLTLGAPLSEVEALAQDRIEGAIRHLSPSLSERRVYGNAVGFSAPDRSEILLSIFDDSTEDKRALALMSHRVFEPGTLTVESLKKSLIEKYGTPAVPLADTHMMWGVPPQEVDPYSICGGTRTFNGREAPQMAADLDEEELNQLRSAGAYAVPEWRYYGWPREYASERPEYVERARSFCGPAVVARVQVSDGIVFLTVWLLDTKAAEEAGAKMPEAGAANIDL